MPFVNPGPGTAGEDVVDSEIGDLPPATSNWSNGTSTGFRLNDDDGYFVVFTGTGLGGFINGGLPTTGTIESVTFFNNFGQSYNVWTNLTLAAADFVTALDTANATLLQNALFGGADTINGAATADYLFGYGGADIITPGAGADEVYGGEGNDTVRSLGTVTNEILDGGAGTDTLSVLSTAPVPPGNPFAGTSFVFFFNGTITGFEALSWAETTNATSAVFVFQQLGPVVPTNATLTGSTFADSILFTVGGQPSGTYSIANANFTLVNWDTDPAIRDVIVLSANPSTPNTNNYDLIGSQFGDFILGNDGNDLLLGEVGDDILAGDDGNDVLSGWVGNDRLDGGANFTVRGQNQGGGAGDYASYAGHQQGVTVSLLIQGTPQDTIGAGVDTLIGIESLEGGSGGDTLTGDNSNNYIYAYAGADVVTANEGADFLAGGAGDDVLDGGAGVDRASYFYADFANGALVGTPSGVTVDLAVAGPQNTGAGGVDTLISIEDLSGTAHADTLRGDAGANWLWGNAGDDVLEGRDGDDTLEGAEGSDVFDGGEGTDHARFYNNDIGGAITVDLAIVGQQNTGHGLDTFISIENVTGTTSGDVIAGNDAANRLAGLDRDQQTTANLTSGADTLIGRGGDDTLEGDDGDDLLNGGLGADVLDGGAGVDTASYANAAAAVTVFLGGPQLNSGEAVGDSYVSIENVTGSAFADLIGGLNDANRLEGLDGNDWLIGAGGDDLLVGGAGNDILDGGLGADQLIGGDGFDVAMYVNAAAGLTIDMIEPLASTGEAAGDTFVDVENVWASAFNDIIVHSTLGGQVYGFDGDDTLIGNGGDDNFYGGRGSDAMTFGSGADTIFYLRWDPGNYEGGDTITNFTSGVDRIFVSRFFFGFGGILGPAAALTSGDAGFYTGGASPTDTRPSFIYNQGTGELFYDPDGSGPFGSALLLATLTPGTVVQLGDIWTA